MSFLFRTKQVNYRDNARNKHSADSRFESWPADYSYNIFSVLQGQERKHFTPLPSPTPRQHSPIYQPCDARHFLFPPLLTERINKTPYKHIKLLLQLKDLTIAHTGYLPNSVLVGYRVNLKNKQLLSPREPCSVAGIDSATGCTTRGSNPCKDNIISLPDPFWDHPAPHAMGLTF